MLKEMPRKVQTIKEFPIDAKAKRKRSPLNKFSKFLPYAYYLFLGWPMQGRCGIRTTIFSPYPYLL